MSGDSNGAWGELAEHSNEIAETWDSFKRLPEPGQHDALDAFCKRKNITHRGLLRLGTRMSDDNVLAFPYPGGIKYRDIVSDKRWNYYGSEFNSLKLVRAEGSDTSDQVLLSESETDAAWLTEHYPIDVAILPAGARTFRPHYADQLVRYKQVLVALDNDEAGEDGARKIAELVPHATRFAPPTKDWAESEEAPELPPVEERPALTDVVWAGDLMELEAPDIPSWFDHDILPIAGLMVIHGWLKSYKTFTGLDLMAAVAQGEPWCHFECLEEPGRIMVIQFELPWPYYRQRVNLLRENAKDRERFDRNFGTFSPLIPPRFTVGDKKMEDRIVRTMVENEVHLMFFDPVRRAMAGMDMNSEADVSKMLRFFERVQDEGITVVATHHDNKEAGRKGGGDAIDMTGASAWGGNPDTIVSITLPQGEDHRTSTKRNLQFLCRNSPFSGTRAFTMDEHTGLVYQTEPFGWEDETSTTMEGELPSI